jgi:predicted PurR-regulated permease PerM
MRSAAHSAANTDTAQSVIQGMPPWSLSDMTRHMIRDSVAEFVEQKTPKRFLSIFGFLALIFLFRKLFILFALAVGFHRFLGATSQWVSNKLKCQLGLALSLVLTCSTALVALCSWLFARPLLANVGSLRHTAPQLLADLQQNTLVQSVSEYFPDSDTLTNAAHAYASEVFRAASTVGHVAAYSVVALILACLALLQAPAIEQLRQRATPSGLVGTWLRWSEHLTEAIALLIQLQLVVALVNAVFTMPILLALRLPHPWALLTLVFVSGLVPVLGNIASGAVLCVLAFQSQGLVGVALFLVLTFVLHKVEAYFLNPRLSARHVKLPGFVLVLSLVACEHLFGFVGFFVSFPMLFVVGKVLLEFRETDESLAKSTSAIETHSPSDNVTV